MIDVMIITYNEAVNLPHCLAALRGWVNRVFVIDSGSTDGTQEIARAYGAVVVHHDWEGYARQKNWGLRELPFESDWLLLLDADEVVTPELRAKIESIVKRPIDQVRENGFFINRLTYFMGKPIRHCGYFPNWNMRLFKRGKGRFEDREVHEHVIIDDPVGRIRECLLHDDRRGLEHYFAKHNRYSTLEAQATFREITQGTRPADEVNISLQSRLRRWAKRNLLPRLPFPGLWRFLYMYVLQLGFLDGRTGFQFAAFISGYDWMVSLKLRELRQRAQRGEKLEFAPPALAQPEGTQGGETPVNVAHRSE